LVVRLAPSTGVVPLDAEARVAPYTFQILALDRQARKAYASAQTFVRPGQSRSVDEKTDQARVRGAVSLNSSGTATYSAELIRQGRAVARSSATVRLEPVK
jgi:hypothetical protein